MLQYHSANASSVLCFLLGCAFTYLTKQLKKKSSEAWFPVVLEGFVDSLIPGRDEMLQTLFDWGID